MAMGKLPEPNGDDLGDGVVAEINITPLTDIFLVLLIIFMVTTTAIAEAGGQNGGLKVTLPRGGKAGDVQEVHDLAVAVLADGQLAVGGKMVDEAALGELLSQAYARNPDTLVLVQADEGVIHGRVVEVMDLARRKGLSRLAIATRAESQ